MGDVNHPEQVAAAIKDAIPWMHMCGSCDAGLPMECSCPKTDPRKVIHALFESLMAVTMNNVGLPEPKPTVVYDPPS